MNYKDCLEKGTENLERAGITEAKLDARLLLEYVCKTDHSTLFAHPDRAVTDDEEKLYDEFIARRVKREPVAYILGSEGLTFFNAVDALMLCTVIPEKPLDILHSRYYQYINDKDQNSQNTFDNGCKRSISDISSDNKL